METFSIFCSDQRAKDIKNELTALGFYVSTENVSTGGYEFTVDGPVHGDEIEEIARINVLRALVAILAPYAGDR